MVGIIPASGAFDDKIVQFFKKHLAGIGFPETDRFQKGIPETFIIGRIRFQRHPIGARKPGGNKSSLMCPPAGAAICHHLSSIFIHPAGNYQ
jgi:hypothetical protein